MARSKIYCCGKRTPLKQLQHHMLGFVVGFWFATGVYVIFNTVALSETNRAADCFNSCSCGRLQGERISGIVRNRINLEADQNLDRDVEQQLGSEAEQHLDRDADPGRKEQMFIEEEKLQKDDYSVANELYKKVRVLCWVLTQPANLETRARHIKNTWGRRCHKLLFFSSVANESFPTIGLNTSDETRKKLNLKTMGGFQYVFKHHFKDYDWFLKTDDDAYVIMENLRYFLSNQDTNGTFYFGHHFKTLVPGGYFSGGPGIVLGREALKRYAAASYTPKCSKGTGPADAELGRCLHTVGIKPGNSTDILGRSRFHCLNPDAHVNSLYPKWFYAYDAHGAHGGRETMSDYAIGFHYVYKDKINALEYYVYHLRPYGVRFATQNLNQKLIPTS